MCSSGAACRLCAVGTTDPTPGHRIFQEDNDNDSGHLNQTKMRRKLRSLLGFDPAPHPALPDSVCSECAGAVDFCLQFLERCAKVEEALKAGHTAEDTAASLQGSFPAVESRQGAGMVAIAKY